MKPLVVSLLGVILLVGQALPILAHHSLFAEFDLNNRVTHTGVVTRVTWTNPHAWFYLNVRDDKTGKTTSWAFQLSSPNALARLGWTPHTLKAGDVVTVNGVISKESWVTASAREVWLQSGLKIFGTNSTLNEAK